MEFVHCELAKPVYIPDLPSFIFLLARPRRAAVPRYFFNVLEGHSETLVRDSEGVEFSSLNEAREEAVGLARDFAKHGFYRSMQAWELVVADENGHEVLTVPLSDIGPRKIQAWFDLIRHFATFETSIHPNILGWLLATAMLGVIVQAAVKIAPLAKNGETYQTALAQTEGVIVAIRFVPNASIADINQFLEAYKASFVGGPQSGAFYRLRIADTSLPREELTKLMRRMAQETVVEFVTR